MNDFRSRFDPTNRFGESERPAAPPAEEPVEVHLPCFSLLSADRRRSMLEFRFRGGNARALAYSYLVSLEMDPSKAIAMDFSGYRVELVGRNLAPLFAGLVAQRVAVVRELDDLHAEATLARDATVVTGINVTPI